MNKIRALEVIYEFMQNNAHLLAFDEHTAFSIVCKLYIEEMTSEVNK